MDEPTTPSWFAEFEAMVRTGAFVEQPDYSGINAELYDDQRGDTSAEVGFYESLFEEGGRVAELGCGTGALTLPLAGRSSDYWAVDNSPDMLAKLEQKLQKAERPVPVRLVASDMASIEFDGPFDLIFVPFNGLVHVIQNERVQALFTNAARALGPHGKLVVDVWIPTRPTTDTKKRCSVLRSASGTWLVYSEESFPSRDRRMVNLATVPIGSDRGPVLTRFIERVFRRRELDRLFRLAGMRARRLPTEHLVIGGQNQRYVGIGECTGD